MLRILVDECINPRLADRLRSVLVDASVVTVRELKREGSKDHYLIPHIQGSFDVFLTNDKGFEFEHNLRRLSFGIIVLTAANNQMPSYERLLDDLVRAIPGARPGQVTHVADPRR